MCHTLPRVFSSLDFDTTQTYFEDNFVAWAFIWIFMMFVAKKKVTMLKCRKPALTWVAYNKMVLTLSIRHKKQQTEGKQNMTLLFMISFLSFQKYFQMLVTFQYLSNMVIVSNLIFERGSAQYFKMKFITIKVDLKLVDGTNEMVISNYIILQM